MARLRRYPVERATQLTRTGWGSEFKRARAARSTLSSVEFTVLSEAESTNADETPKQLLLL